MVGMHKMPNGKMMKDSDMKGNKFERVMHEFKHGELHSGSKRGKLVTSRAQAKAIAVSETKKQARGGY